MAGVAARPVTAEVIDLKALADRADEKLIHDAVYVLDSTISSYLPISSGPSRAPLPARIVALIVDGAR